MAEPNPPTPTLLPPPLPTTEEEEDQIETEIKELKENAKNLTDCLHTLTRRIESLEGRRGVSGEPMDTFNGRPQSPDPLVRVEKHESASSDGSVTKRIHVVTSKKTTYSQQGLTVRQENGQLVVARIMTDSPLAKQGDAILEVNGVEVKTPDDLQTQLKKSGEGVSLKTIPSGLERPPPPDAIYVKTFVDYDPQKDDLIPCKEIGLSFKAGDILQIISKEDVNWWQARNIKEWSRIGLIPSETLEESRKAGSGIDASKKQALGGLVSLHKRRKVMYNSKQNAVFDKSDILIYEEVGKLSPYGRRVLVLVGAPGVGRRTLKALILKHDPKNFATVIPYTSREKRPGEQDGREYHFVTKKDMQRDIDEGVFLEWGEFNGNLYGTSLDSVRHVMKSGRMCVLDSSPQAIKYLYSHEFMPYVVCVTPPPLEEMKQLYKIHPNRTKPKGDEDMKKTCEESSLLESQYAPIFDLNLVNRNVDVTFRRLIDGLESLKTETQWVPISWLYG